MMRSNRRSGEEEGGKKASSYTELRILPEERKEIWDATMLTTLRR